MHQTAQQPTTTGATSAVADRFWSKVDKSGTCWLWTAAIDRGGYGFFSVTPTRQRGAHRVAWELANGPIADGLEVDHLCRVRACVNPEHLEAVTPEENQRRRRDTKTHCPKGHELTDENKGRRANGTYQCKPCNRAITRRNYYARKQAAA